MENKVFYNSGMTYDIPDEPLKKFSFEDAVAKIGSGRFHFALLLTSGIALLSVVLESINMAFVLPAAKCELNLSINEQGLINAVAFIGVVLTSHFWGFMADTWGRRKVIQTALSTSFVFSVVSCLSTTSTMLLLTRLAVGLCVSGVQAAAISYLGEFHSNKTRAKHVTFAAMFMSMAVAYQALMGLFIMPRDWEFSFFGLMLIRPWRMYIFISSCASAIAFVAISFLPESPKFDLSMGRNKEALATLRKAYVANGLGSAKEFPVKELQLLETIGSNLADTKGIASIFQLVWKQTKPLLEKEHIGNVLMMCFLTFSIYSVSHGAYLWYPQILTMNYPFMDQPVTTCQAVAFGFQNISANSDSPTNSSECNTTEDPMTYYIILVMGSFFLVIFSFVALNLDRIGAKWLSTVWLSLSTLTGLGLLWTNQFYLNVASTILLYTCANCGHVLCVLAADLFPTHFKSMALCFIMMSGRIGAVAGSNFVGAMIDGNCEYIFGVTTVLLAVSVGVSYYILLKKERLLKVANF